MTFDDEGKGSHNTAPLALSLMPQLLKFFHPRSRRIPKRARRCSNDAFDKAKHRNGRIPFRRNAGPDWKADLGKAGDRGEPPIGKEDHRHVTRGGGFGQGDDIFLIAPDVETDQYIIPVKVDDLIAPGGLGGVDACNMRSQDTEMADKIDGKGFGKPSSRSMDALFPVGEKSHGFGKIRIGGSIEARLDIGRQSRPEIVQA